MELGNDTFYCCFVLFELILKSLFALFFCMEQKGVFLFYVLRENTLYTMFCLIVLCCLVVMFLLLID